MTFNYSSFVKTNFLNESRIYDPENEFKKQIRLEAKINNYLENYYREYYFKENNKNSQLYNIGVDELFLKQDLNIDLSEIIPTEVYYRIDRRVYAYLNYELKESVKDFKKLILKDIQVFKKINNPILNKVKNSFIREII